MANISDVEDTLVNLIAGFLYPNGNTNPSVIPSVNNISVFAGFPLAVNLERDLNVSVNNAYVTIPPPVNAGRNTTRFPQVWHDNYINSATITATVINNTLIIGGFVSSSQGIMTIVNGIGYSYLIQISDTLDSIATNIASILPSATSLSNVVTVNGSYSLTANVFVVGVAVKEIKRQEVIFTITTWANSRDKRTAISNVIEIGLGALDRFVLPVDNYFAPIVYSGIRDFDELQKTYSIYRRDLMFKIEYPTTILDNFVSVGQVVNKTLISPFPIGD